MKHAYQSRSATERRRLPNVRWLGLCLLFALALTAAAVYGSDSRSAVASDDNGACEQGGAVADPASNPGLAQDCNALLAMRDTLAGDAQLNWSADLSIQQWDGVSVFNAPARVVSLKLPGRELSGSIPAELGSLDSLEVLDLSGNELIGSIPPELGSLGGLRYLYLDDNGLTGEIPAELGSLTNLRHLMLSDNGLTGGVPFELGELSQLEYLFLDNNRLTGCMPRALLDRGDLTIRADDLEPCSLCSEGSDVSDSQDRPPLLRDCATLVAVRDVLAGEATLNWSYDIPITEWDGVTVGGAPLRVTRLRLSDSESNRTDSGGAGHSHGVKRPGPQRQRSGRCDSSRTRQSHQPGRPRPER